MIYPSARAIGLAASAALPAIVIALAMPGIWYAGLALVLVVLGLTLADALAAAPFAVAEATLEVPRTAGVGATVDLAVRARHPGLLREAVIENDERLQAEADARGRFRDALVLPFVAARRGSARVDALWLRWAGPLGLAWRQRRLPLDREIAVLPDIRPARAEALRLFRRDALIGETVQLDTGAGGEFQALTEFRAGMDRRTIDWKASGRHGALIAKEYRTERNNEIVLALDTGRLMCEPVDGVPRIDRAVAAALTAAYVALRLGDRVSLFAFDARPRLASGAVAGVASFGTVQALAAGLDYSSEETNFTLALTTLGGRLQRRSLVLVFTDFVDPTSAELMLRTVGRLAERHLVLFVLMRDAELEAMADAAPADPDDVSRAVVAAAMLRERRLVAARLQRLGVHLVEAPWQRLGPALVNAYLDLKRRNLL